MSIIGALMHFLDFRFIASFPNQNAVETKFRTFYPLPSPVKLR